MRNLLLAALAAFLMSPALAADLPVKAQAQPLFVTPYTGAGWYVGLEAGGGAGSAGVSGIPGVNNAALIQTQGFVGGLVGYSAPAGAGNVYWFAEADLGWNNLNGNTAGFSMTGPVTSQLMVGIGGPASQFLSVLPTFGLTPPTLPSINGTTTTNPHIYVAAGVDISDVSAAFALANNTDWQFSPMIGIGIDAQLSTGGVIGDRIEYVIQTDSICVGGMCAKTGNIIRDKITWKF